MLFLLILLYLAYINIEGFVNKSDQPDLLIFQNNKYWLINTNKQINPGKNPILFNSINDYKKYSKDKKYNNLKPSSKKIPMFVMKMILNTKPNKEKKLIKDKSGSYLENITKEIKKKTGQEYIEEEYIEEELDLAEIEEEVTEVSMSQWLSNNKNKLKNKRIYKGKSSQQPLYQKTNQSRESNKKGRNQQNKKIKYFRQPDKKQYSDYGFNYMPATSWSVPQQRPPPCIPQKNCPVCPVVDKGTPVDAVEWNQVGSILPKFKYKEVFNPNYYYPGWISGNVNKLLKNYPKYNQNFSMEQPFKPTN